VGSRTHRYGSAASPVVYKDWVIVNASVESESLVALDRRTGREVWRAGGIRDAWNTPHLVRTSNGTMELVVAINGAVLGFDPERGEQRWRCAGVEDYITPSVVSYDGVVYALLGRAGGVLAVRAGGRGDVTDTHVLWRLTKGRNVASPVYYQGYLYFVTEALGVVRCLDAKSGAAAYEERLTPAPGEVYASPVIADGKLYIVSRERGAFVLAAKPQFELLAHNDLGDRSLFNASPAVSGGHLLLRSDRFLYSIGMN
ncbi:MAG: PQQ-binding-like beta-propeller repeat protein, partial [Abditibacteriales bacterium]|nr:PQQ-binding-like beta-propeller repeat protein [Abditibacteriales bacterium]